MSDSGDPLVGKVLDGRYRVARKIGGGGMGAVYEAQHTGTGRRVAVKVISTGDVTKDKGLVARFQREARAAGAIDTQHIAQVLDTGVDPASGGPYMVMEYLEGEDLAELLQRLKPLPPEVALRITAQACIGLQKAHDTGVVHRDIKPANLFLARRDEGALVVKVLDFGVAKVKMDHAIQQDATGLTRTGSMIGSPLYMSPEQARGTKDIDHRADVWSLGVVLYQALCGKTPHHDIDALGELIISICAVPPQPVQERAPWVPREVAAIVHRALRFDAAERFQSAAEMLDEIRIYLPNGWSLHQSMLAPLTDDDRGRIAPRLSAAALSMRPQLRGSSAEILVPPVAASTDPNGTNAGVAHSPHPGTPPPRPSRGVWFAAGGAAAVGIAGVVLAAKLLGGPGDKPAPADVAPVVAATPPATRAQTPEVAPTAQERRVKLVIFPDDAAVTIDGIPATVKDGIVEISGGLGSVHKVRLSAGSDELERDVVVSDSGALPPKLDLGAAKSQAKPVTGAKAGAGAPKPTAAPEKGPAPATAKPKIDREFN